MSETGRPGGRVAERPVYVDVPLLERQDAGARRVWAAMVLIAAGAAVFARLSFLPAPFRNDAGIYVYMGKLLSEGGGIYREAWETKLPTVGLLTAPLWQVFGANWAGYVAVQAALGVGAAVALALGVRRFVGAGGYLPTLLFMLVQFNQTRLTMTGFQLETVQGFFAACAAGCALGALRNPARWDWPVLVGALAACAAMGKPTGLAVAGAFGIATLVAPAVGWRTRVRWILGVCGGAALVLGPVGWWLWRSPMAADLPEVLRQIRLYGSETPWRQPLALKNWLFLGIIVAPLAIRFGVERLSRLEVRPRARLDWAMAFFAAAWFAVELTGVVLQRRTYAYHLLVLVPPVALLYGLLPLRTRPISVAASLLPGLALSVGLAVAGIVRPWFPFTPKVVEYVVAHTQPGDAVWGEQSAALWLTSDRRPGTRLSSTVYFVNHDDAGRLFGGWILDDLESRRPKYVLIRTDWDAAKKGAELSELRDNPGRLAEFVAAWGRIEAYLQANYRVEHEIDGTLFYRRRT